MTKTQRTLASQYADQHDAILWTGEDARIAREFLAAGEMTPEQPTQERDWTSTPLWVQDDLGGHLDTQWFADAMLFEHKVEKVVYKPAVGRLWLRWTMLSRTYEGWVDYVELKQHPDLLQHLRLAYKHLANFKQSLAYTL